MALSPAPLLLQPCTHQLTHLLLQLFTHPSNYTPTHPSIRPLIHPHIHPGTHPPTHLHLFIHLPTYLGFPCGSAGKESPAMWETWVGKTPGEGKVFSILQYTGLENSMDCIVHGSAELGMTEQRSLSPLLSLSPTYLTRYPFYHSTTHPSYESIPSLHPARPQTLNEYLLVIHVFINISSKHFQQLWTPYL